jgi:antitoxin protein of toxin-antitoxin system
MGILDKLKGLVSGHKKEVGEGIDKAADVAKDKIGHDKEVDKAADAAKGALGVDDKKK